MERMQSEAKQLQAEGIVGVQLVERSHGWGAHVIEFFAVGTAVTAVGDAPSIPTPEVVLGLMIRAPPAGRSARPPARP